MNVNKTRGIKLDFEALSRYGVDSNKKVLTKKATRANQIKPKSLGDLVETDKFGYWSDPAGEKFLSDFSSDMGSPSRGRSRTRSNESGSDDGKENKTITNNEADQDSNQDDGEGDAEDSKNATPVQDCSQKSDDQVSLYAKGDFDSPAKNVKTKNNVKITKHRPPVKGKARISVELKAKIEEEKQLKKECDALEYEVSQTEKLQDNIDKFKQKIKELKKRKEGDKSVKVKKISKENSFSIKSKGILTKQEIMNACSPVFEKLQLNKSDQSEFISELLERATRRKKLRRQKRESFRKNRDYSPSSSTDSSSSSEDSSSEDDRKKGSYTRGRSRSPRSRSRSLSRSPIKRKGKLKSGITEKPKEADLVMKVKWATALLGTKSEIAFDDMSFDQYILGETQILNRPKISEAEKSTRIHVMKRISKLNEKLGFSKSKELYREVLNAIEKGEFTWCNYYEIERLENEIRFDNMSVVECNVDESKKKVDADIKWCKEFNGGRCTFQTHHQGKLAGQIVKLWHICRVCWSKSKQKKFHKAGAEECQFTVKQE